MERDPWPADSPLEEVVMYGFVSVMLAVGLFLMMLIGVTAIVRQLAWRDDSPPSRSRDRRERSTGVAE